MLYTRMRHAGLARQCNICGARLRQFVAHGIPPEPAFLCPACGSKPPHRLAACFFASHDSIWLPGGLLVHIAPEPALGRRLATLSRQHGMRYVAGGLNGVGPSRMDILALPFADQSVHLIYCCHVLNCLQDDRRAMSEVRRVLHPEGLAILQVPAFHLGDTTFETNGQADRMAAFGDDGIHRCYTDEDYQSRLRASGFQVDVFSACMLPATQVQKHELKRETMHLCRLQAPSQ
jgi:SAM-dependent methyltransferase